MTTTVISTVETMSVETSYEGGSLLITGTGGYIDTAGDGLGFTSSPGGPIGQVTIEAGGLVFGNGNGIDFVGFNASGTFLIDGSVQGNADGMNLTDDEGDTGSATITIGSQGSISGGTAGIQANLDGDLDITNHGTITGGTNGGVNVGATQVEITNTGTIDGVDIFAGTANNITNLGTIDGQVYLVSGTYVENTGFIDSITPASDAPPASVANVDITNSGTVGGVQIGDDAFITNSGTIGALSLGNSATVYDTGMVVFGVSAGSNSNVTVTAQGTVEGYTATGISVGADSIIKNAGFVDGSTGIAAETGAGATDIALTNTGTIMGGVNFSASTMDTITNGGSLSGGLVLGSEDHAYNTGTIHNGLVSNGDDYVENDGTISGGADLGVGTQNMILNSGKIGSGLTLGQDCTADNSGAISGGIYGSGGDTITNSGTLTLGITDTLAATDSSGATDTIDNSGKISGNISEQSADLTNSGAIDGAVSFISQGTLVNSDLMTGGITFSGSDDTFDNAGDIHGNITLGTTDTFTNTGTIHGNVVLGNYDTLDLSPGTITGTITADFYDTFDFSGSFGHFQIAKFTGTGTHHDTIDFSTNDFTSYSELQSHMVQEGNDVVITLDANDSIVLTATLMAHLSSTDFNFV